MKILFRTNSLNLRGTSVAILDYAIHNQEILGNDSIICYDGNIDFDPDMGNDFDVIQHVSSNIRVEKYDGIKNINQLLDRVKPDLMYQLVSGDLSDNIKVNCKLATHAVFQYKNNFIDAYVSKWLSDKMYGGDVPHVPHIVDMPEPKTNYRKLLNIPDEAFVFGRYGGLSTFDIPFVKKYIDNFSDDKVYFIFMGTEKFTNNKQCRFIKGTHDLQKKSNFISTCDAMIHARLRGESFGLSICEFLFHNKPVLSWSGGVDMNHREILKYPNSLYDNVETLNDVIYEMVSNKCDINYKQLVQEFSPENVMRKFKDVFLT